LPSTLDVLPFPIPFIIIDVYCYTCNESKYLLFAKSKHKVKKKKYHQKSKTHNLIGPFEVTWHVHMLQTILSSHIQNNTSLYKFIPITFPLHSIEWNILKQQTQFITFSLSSSNGSPGCFFGFCFFLCRQRGLLHLSH